MTSLQHPCMALVATLSGIDIALWDLAGKTEGFNFFKFNIDRAFAVERPFPPTVTSEEMRKLYRGYANVREATGDVFDLGVACHGELDTPSGIAISRAVEPLNVAFVEDSLNTHNHERFRISTALRAVSAPREDCGSR